MPDIALDWGGDFSLDNTGDLQLVDGDDYARQSIERRLCTAVRSYIYHLDDGAGLLQQIGMAPSLSTITSLVRAQIALEESVSPSPAPIVTVTKGLVGAFYIHINYTDANTKQQVALTIAT